MLENAEYLVLVTIVLVAIAFMATIAAFGRSQTVRAETSVPVAVGVGARDSSAPPPTIPTADPARFSAPHRVALGTVGLAIALLTVYIVIRTAATGYGPFTNQHEFAISFVWGILAVHLYFQLRYDVVAVGLIVLPVVAGLLLYAMSLDTGVRPVMPALQNNLLLSLHVGTAMLSYGAACVSFGAAALYLIKPRVKKGLPSYELLDEVGYRAAVVAYPLITLMIVLGAIWADTAWGRFWGWDPKETAALVTWLIWSGYLHARVIGGWRGKKAAWLIVIGFAAVLFAYFGNHFFGGLHSYA